MTNDPEPKIEISIELIADLASQGVELGEDHEVEHFFLADNEMGPPAADGLVDAGYRVKGISHFDDESAPMFGILAVHPIDEPSITHAIMASCAVGDRLGIGYDGWDVDVSRWHLKSMA